MKTTLKELCQGGGEFDATPSAFMNLWGRFPRVGAGGPSGTDCLPARNANPGLMDLNPAGIRGWSAEKRACYLNCSKKE
jgi:hypothetical protein